MRAVVSPSAQQVIVWQVVEHQSDHLCRPGGEVAGDILPPQIDALEAGRSHAPLGQRPFEMGYKASAVMIELIKGTPTSDPLFTDLDECTPENVDSCLAK
jgi:hypothetical protein